MSNNTFDVQKKIGRPLETPFVRDKIITFRLNKREDECLSGWCERYDVSPSDVIRECLMILSVIPEPPHK